MLKEFLKKMPVMIALSKYSISDQFDSRVDWVRFSKVPKVIVMAGQDAAPDAKLWGVFFQQRFNSSYMPTPGHLQNLAESEKIKVVAVATLPEVPRIFRGLFRSGFRRESREMGVGLDFSEQLSQGFGYRAQEKTPAIAVLPAGDGQVDAQIFRGASSDLILRGRIEAEIGKQLLQDKELK